MSSHYELIRSLTNQYKEKIISLRREFHQYPELSFTEERTPQRIAGILKELGLEVREKVGNRGVVARLKGEKPGPTVALRADMDALAVFEHKENCVYASLVPGVMHACGHDGHMAIVLGVAYVLSKMKKELPGCVQFLFQHAEEITPGGALEMIEDGCLKGVDAVFALHLNAGLKTGEVRIVLDKPMTAASDKFKIQIQGRGGHGSQPQECIDPLVVAAHLVINCQSIISRNLEPTAAGVISFGVLKAEGAFNIIPDTVYLEGTVRSFYPQVRTLLKKELEKKIAHTCSMFDATYRLTYDYGYPPLRNHEREGKLVLDVAQKVSGYKSACIGEPLMWGEDFVYYLTEIPGAFFLLGSGGLDKSTQYPHHHPCFDIDEEALTIGTELMANLAWAYNMGFNQDFL